MKKSLLSLLACSLLAGQSIAQCSGTTSVASNFNGTSIAAGNKIWFSAVLKVTGSTTYPLTINFKGQTISSSAFTLSLPDASLTLDPSATSATTIYNGTTWVTTAPPGMSGNYFISGFTDSLATGLSGGLNPVTWSGTFSASHSGVSINWQWGAAVYTSFNANLNDLGVKPSDCNSCSVFANSDHAGTPEDYKTHVIGGARGGGGANYTGSYSATGSVSPCVSVTPAVSVAASSTSICSGSSVTFTATAVNGGSSPSYQWKKNGVNVGTGSATYTTASLSSGDTVYVVLTSSDLLASPSTATSNKIGITVTSSPAVADILGSASVCAGGSLTLTDATPGGTWSSSNTLVATVTSGGVVTAAASGTAIISYTVAGSCGSAVATKTVTVSPGFTVTACVTNVTCNGYTNGSVVTSVTPAGSYSYSWNTGATTTGLWGVEAGVYTVHVTGEGGCAETNSFTVTQPAPLSGTAVVTNVTTPGGSNGSIVFTASGGTPPYSYLWCTGAVTPAIFCLSAGTYIVTTTDANSCTETDVYAVTQPCAKGVVSAGASATAAGNSYSTAYPDPFVSQTVITFSFPSAGYTTVDIYNGVNGEKVGTVFSDNISAGNEYSCTLDGTDLPSGMYIYKISSGKNISTGKVLLQK